MKTQYLATGTIHTGYYVGDEWKNGTAIIIAKANSRKKLRKEIDRLTQKNTKTGTQIDFGFIDNTASVIWNSKIWKQTKSLK